MTSNQADGRSEPTSRRATANNGVVREWTYNRTIRHDIRRFAAFVKHVIIILGNYWKHFILRRDFLRPVYAIYELTYGCELNCFYCDDGRGLSYPDQASKVRPLPLADALEMIQKLRRDVPGIYLSGGEPCSHPAFLRILYEIDALGYNPVMLNTNGLQIEQHLKCDPDFLRYVDVLIISLDSMNPAKLDDIFQSRGGLGQRVLDTIAMCVELRRSFGFTLAVNCVITRDTITDAAEVAKFCKGTRIKFTPVVANRGMGFRDDLRGNPDYEKLVDELTRDDAPSALGDPKLFRSLLHFEPFICYPALRLHITPDGEVRWPCQTNTYKSFSMCDYGSLRGLLAEAERQFAVQGFGMGCQDQCFLAQNLGTNLYFTPTAWHGVRDLILGWDRNQ